MNLEEIKLFNNCPRKLKYEEIGLVEGNTVQSRFFARDIIAGIRTFFGLEVIEYTELLNKSRRVAKARMVAEAQELGANAIINIRYMTSEIAEQSSEVFIYGTAVRLVE